MWLPRAARVMRMCGTRTLAEPDPGANNSLLAPHVEAGAIGAFKELMEDTIANGAYFCDIETERYRQLKSYPPFVKDCCCKKKYDAHVVGPRDLMMSSELTEHQDSLGEIDYEVAVPLSEAKAALTACARLREGEAPVHAAHRRLLALLARRGSHARRPLGHRRARRSRSRR